jgi:hypothetical protein
MALVRALAAVLLRQLDRRFKNAVVAPRAHRSHGPWFDSNASETLQRTFGWTLQPIAHAATKAVHLSMVDIATLSRQVRLTQGG